MTAVVRMGCCCSGNHRGCISRGTRRWQRAQPAQRERRPEVQSKLGALVSSRCFFFFPSLFSRVGWLPSRLSARQACRGLLERNTRAPSTVVSHGRPDVAPRNTPQQPRTTSQPHEGRKEPWLKRGRQRPHKPQAARRHHRGQDQDQATERRAEAVVPAEGPGVTPVTRNRRRRNRRPARSRDAPPPPLRPPPSRPPPPRVPARLAPVPVPGAVPGAGAVVPAMGMGRRRRTENGKRGRGSKGPAAAPVATVAAAAAAAAAATLGVVVAALSMARAEVRVQGQERVGVRRRSRRKG